MSEAPIKAAGTSMELAAARLNALFGPCAHPDAVPVESLAGQRVAWLCPACDTQLPPDYWITVAERDLLGIPADCRRGC